MTTPKWIVTLHFDLAADYEVEAESEEQAIEEAKRISNEETDRALLDRSSHELSYDDAMAFLVENALGG